MPGAAATASSPSPNTDADEPHKRKAFKKGDARGDGGAGAGAAEVTESGRRLLSINEGSVQTTPGVEPLDPVHAESE